MPVHLYEGATMRALVIDCNEQDRLKTVQVLRQGSAEMEIVEFSAAIDAFKLFPDDSEFDVVICRWRNFVPNTEMTAGGIDGLTLMLHMRRHPIKRLRTMPIVILTVLPRCQSHLHGTRDHVRVLKMEELPTLPAICRELTPEFVSQGL